MIGAGKMLENMISHPATCGKAQTPGGLHRETF